MITGKSAEISSNGVAGITVGESVYDGTTNTQTTRVTIAKGNYPQVSHLMSLTFTGTQTSELAPNNTGFRNLRFIAPGYADKQDQLFTDDWAAVMKPFGES